MYLSMDDTVGVFVTTEGDLHFTINEVDKGVAWRHLPTDRPLYVVINLFGEISNQISVDKSTFSKYNIDHEQCYLGCPN